MSKELIINSENFETRIALLENGNIVELYIERNKHKNLVGNIYKGKVANLLPGLQSAFIDIGEERSAFLHASDIMHINKNNKLVNTNNIIEDIEEGLRLENLPSSEVVNPPIEDLLEKNDDILIQIIKEPIDQKGPRATTCITIPGRLLVLMPNIDHIGVSRKIEDSDEIKRLRSILTEIKLPNYGLIARTASVGANRNEIERDLSYLLTIWNDITMLYKNAEYPFLLYEEQDLLVKILRDTLTNDVKRIIIDNEENYERVNNFILKYMPEIDVKIDLYSGNTPIFDHFYNIELEINRLSEKKIWLKSGGYIVIDQCEALTVIDVNTGKYTGKKDFESTIFKTNLEAAKEIAYQLILRNIGGIIVVDFIDMSEKEHRDKVLTTLSEELKKDRLKSSVINITPLGLVEITRKRVQNSLTRFLTEACPYCDGSGRIKSIPTIVYEILREVKTLAKTSNKNKINIYAQESIIDYILNNEKEYISFIEMNYNVSIIPNIEKDFHQEYYIVK
ncbi:MAG: Rne/Rng family ribonuclease [Deferribacterota bacterium]|nr:Rne/Rng family ribonuclease [Deferribacterota bacterium]